METTYRGYPMTENYCSPRNPGVVRVCVAYAPTGYRTHYSYRYAGFHRATEARACAIICLEQLGVKNAKYDKQTNTT